MLTLVIATKNKGKIKELNQILKDLPIKLKSLDEFENIAEVAETGETFAENAKLKAESYAVQTGFWSLADDSGLEVEALNNAPGVFSARYAGENSDDEKNVNKLLDELDKTNNINRYARFVCVIAIANEKGKTQYIAKGICNGRIAEKPFGTNGFGYDPLFIPDGFEKTFGELSGDIKQKISHRAIALKKIIDFFNVNTAS
ncbi:MAG: XTP/dITP diphosphatase [Aridibacter sp.]